MDREPKIAVLLTTYNRCEATVKCIKSLLSGNPGIDFRFVVADDNSSDDTVNKLQEMHIKLKVLEGNGSMFWNGGMRKAIDFTLKSADKLDYVLLINDDVEFYEGRVRELLSRINESKADVIVGATEDKDGKMSYGGVIRTSKTFAKFKLLEPTKDYEQCDTFNCNCVLMTSAAFKRAGNLDGKYTHSMGDYDYGIHIRKLGMTVISSDNYVGFCNDNDDGGTWRDTSLSRKERLRLKEGPKGLPFKDWFHFVRKNYGLMPAIYHSMTPYIRILIKK